MSYCRVGLDSDVEAFFHVMGYCWCATCEVPIRTKSGLHRHLRQHREREIATNWRIPE